MMHKYNPVARSRRSNQRPGRQGSRMNPNRRAKRKKKRILKNEDSLRDLWDNKKHNNIQILGVLEGEERGQGIQNLFEEIMTKLS